MCGASSAADALFCKLLQRSHPEGMAEVGCSKPASFMQVSTHKAPEDDLAQEMTHDPHGAAARAADWHNPDAISVPSTPHGPFNAIAAAAAQPVPFALHSPVVAQWLAAPPAAEGPGDLGVATARAADWHNPDAISPGGTHARLSLLTRKLTMTMTKGGTIARASTRGQIAR